MVLPYKPWVQLTTVGGIVDTHCNIVSALLLRGKELYGGILLKPAQQRINENSTAAAWHSLLRISRRKVKLN